MYSVNIYIYILRRGQRNITRKLPMTKVKGRRFTEYTAIPLFIIMIYIMIMHCVGVSIHNNAKITYAVYYGTCAVLMLFDSCSKQTKGQQVRPQVVYTCI